MKDRLALLFSDYTDEPSYFFKISQKTLETGINFKINPEVLNKFMPHNLENLSFHLMHHYIKIMGSNFESYLKTYEKNTKNCGWVDNFNYLILFPGDEIELDFSGVKISFVVEDRGSISWFPEFLRSRHIPSYDFSLTLKKPSAKRVELLPLLQDSFVTKILTYKISQYLGEELKKEVLKGMTPLRSVMGLQETYMTFMEDFVHIQRGKSLALSFAMEKLVPNLRNRILCLEKDKTLMPLETFKYK